jgi:hypothetical protein
MVQNLAKDGRPIIIFDKNILQFAKKPPELLLIIRVSIIYI